MGCPISCLHHVNCEKERTGCNLHSPIIPTRREINAARLFEENAIKLQGSIGEHNLVTPPQLYIRTDWVFLSPRS